MNLKLWKQINDITVKTTHEELRNILTFSDEELIVKIGQCAHSQNCEGAAVGHLKVVSKVAPVRSSVEKELLMISFLPLYYMGIEESEALQNWIKWMLSAKKDSFTQEQKDWITEKTSNEYLVNRLFTKIKSLEEQLENEE